MLAFHLPKILLASILALALAGTGIFIGMAEKTSLPQTGYIPVAYEGTDTVPPLDDFVRSVKNGQKNTIVGIYVPGVLALPVGQQPKDNAGYVTRNPDQVTQFNLAGRYGTIGILAHNDLAGAEFSDIQLNTYVVIIYGDGREEQYQVKQFQKYQALSPTSTFSDFINLDGSDERLTAAKLFTRVYGPGERLVLQTCIDAYGDASWGRLFIIAEPISIAEPEVASVQQPSFWLKFPTFGIASR
jgi:hypothetical protein